MGETMAPVPAITAIYVRASSRSQDTASQEPDLKRWVAAQRDITVRWYRDKFTGTTMNRPGFNKLLADIHLGKVNRVVVWRLDRLGRTARGLTDLFEDLLKHGVALVSLKEGLDLKTPAGRLLAHVLASVAMFETELRSERIVAGQAAARAGGQALGRLAEGPAAEGDGGAGRRRSGMTKEGRGVTAVARATGLSRPTVYRVLVLKPGSADVA